MVTIRLSRGGAKKRPFYHIVVADSRRARDSRFIERLGYFDPIASGQGKRLSLNTERASWWIGKGARPSDRVASLIEEAGREPTEAATATPAQTKPVKVAKPEVKAEKPKAEAKAEAPEPQAEASAPEAESEAPVAKAEAETQAEAPETKAVEAEEPKPEADAGT
ncbi:MAG: 30S ribosomal protein S16 [Gammaproteobacteria bacterium]